MQGHGVPITKRTLSQDANLSSSPDWASPSLNARRSSSSPNEEQKIREFRRQDSDLSYSDEDEEIGHIESPGHNGEDAGREGPHQTLHLSGLQEDYTLEFFRPVIDPDPQNRAEALQAISEILKESLATEKKALVRMHIKHIARFAAEVPFQDVADHFRDLLQVIADKSNIVAPKEIPLPSRFIPKKHFPDVLTEEPETKQLYEDIFLQSGRVSHLNRVMALHSTYFSKYYAAYNFIMRESGPLPLDWRNYIAILTAARHKNKWLHYSEELEFLLNGGDERWLESFQNAPKKLVNLMETISFLCHQPWLLTKDHIAKLVKGDDSWSMGELVHAIVIICTFNSLCGVVFGCGVNLEVDFEDFTSSAEEPDEDSTQDDDDTIKLAELLRTGWICSESDEPEQQQSFVKAETLSPQTSGSSNNASSDLGRLSSFIGDSWSMQHSDFDVKSPNYSIFKISDYNWKEDGFELVRRFLPGLAPLLDEEFDYIYSMTYNRFNQSTNMDTFPFRRAVWQYIQRVKGMLHDDYNYQEVNTFLNMSTKNYIKKIACSPEGISKDDFKNIGVNITADEKVHIALLAVESSKQSTLLYGLHAVMVHMLNR